MQSGARGGVGLSEGGGAQWELRDTARIRHMGDGN